MTNTNNPSSGCPTGPTGPQGPPGPSNPPSNPLNAGNWITITIPYTSQPITIADIDLAMPVEKENNSDGCTCKKCKEFYPYAEPNQDDGTLICYGCRMVW